MRMIDKLAADQFGGNIEDALDYLIKNKDNRFPELIKELNKKEAAFAFRKLHEYHVDKIIDEEFGGKEQFANDVMLEMKMDELGMTKDDVVISDKNPFYKNVRNAAIKLGLAVVIPLIIYMMLKSLMNVEWVFWVQGCFITYFASEMAGCLIKYFKFKNVKKKIQ